MIIKKQKKTHFLNYRFIHTFCQFLEFVSKFIIKWSRGKNLGFNIDYSGHVCALYNYIFILYTMTLLSICAVINFQTAKFLIVSYSRLHSYTIFYRRTVFTPRSIGKHQKLVTFERSKFIRSRVSTKGEIRSFGSFCGQ